MDRVRLHILLVFIVVFVDFVYQYLTPFCSVPQIAYMLVANQDSHNNTFSWLVNAGPLAFGSFLFTMFARLHTWGIGINKS